MKRRIGTFQDFKDYTLAVARGERRADPSEPKIWSARTEGAGPPPNDSEMSHYRHSTLRERIIEHVFVGEALRALWNRGARDVELLRSEFDAGGYDIVMTCRNVVRHIQFKSTTEGGKAKSVSISLKLTEKPSGCVIWFIVGKQLELKSYRWLGGPPGEPLRGMSDLKKAKGAKGDAKGLKHEKPNHRIVPVKRFEKLDSIDDVLNRLFGPSP